MLTRRQSLAALIAAPLVAQRAFAQDACAVFTPERQSTVTPDAALARLMAGNARFLSGQTVNCDLLKQVKETSHGQAPFAAILGCIDSRVPPELVFDQRIGDIFAARVAGNFVNTDILGSLEYATKVANAKLIMVLGHGSCGAVKGAIDNVKFGNLTATLANVRPAVAEVKYKGKLTSKDHELVELVAERNARDSAKNLLARSDVLRGLVKEGKLKVVAAMHDIESGKVSLLA